jgi:hypothetical protein
MIKMVRLSAVTGASLIAHAMTMTSAIQVTLTNQCGKDIQVYDNSRSETIGNGGSSVRDIGPGWRGMYRMGTNPQATLAEFSIDGSGQIWYDISIIPTGPNGGPGYCSSLDNCKAVTGGVGFNVAMQIAPSRSSGRCTTLTCLNDGCADAYQYPKDDTKTHTCPAGTNFQVTFCPGGAGGVAPPPPPPPPTQPPTPPPTQAPTPPPTAAPLITSSSTEASSKDATALVSEESSTSSGSDSAEAAFLRGIFISVNGSAASDDVINDFPEVSSSENEAPSTPNASVPIEEVNTQSSGSGESYLGIYITVIFVAVGAIAGAAIFVVRRKKKQLDDMEQKSPRGSRVSEDIFTVTPHNDCL